MQLCKLIQLISILHFMLIQPISVLQLNIYLTNQCVTTVYILGIVYYTSNGILIVVSWLNQLTIV